MAEGPKCRGEDEGGREQSSGPLCEGKVLEDMDSRRRKGIMELRRENVFVTEDSLEGREERVVQWGKCE